MLLDSKIGNFKLAMNDLSKAAVTTQHFVVRQVREAGMLCAQLRLQVILQRRCKFKKTLPLIAI